MNTYISRVIAKYKDKGILIDANLAILYVVGSLDIARIRSHRRTSKYSEDDFSRVEKFIDHFDVKVTTPHVLTEVSNLLGNDFELHTALRGFISLSLEVTTDSRSLSNNNAFLKIGLSDTAITILSKGLYLVFTDDGPLQEFLARDRIDFINLDQLRSI